MELISKLGIDWKLLIAQVINFAILVFILYKFAYRPILDLLEERKRKITQSLEDAKKGEELLKKIEEAQAKRVSDTEKKVGELLAKASKDAEAVKAEIVREARAQADDFLKRAKLQSEEIRAAVLGDVKRDVGTIVVAAIAKILEREFSDADQERLEKAILNEMKTL